MVDQKRSCVTLGSTNEEQLEFLNDPSGSRRFWCFRVGHINLEGLEAMTQNGQPYLQQLWAEAFYHYLNGETHWLDREEEQVYRNLLNKKYIKVDTWQEIIDGWFTERVNDLYNTIDREASKVIDGNDVVDFDKLWKLPGARQRFRFTISEILEGAVGLPRERQAQKDIRRLTDILGRMQIHQIGRKSSGGHYVRTWQLPEIYISRAYRTLQLWKNENDNKLNNQEYNELYVD